MSAMHYVVLVLLALLAVSFVCVLWALDVADDRRAAGGYRSTWKQRRQWRKERRQAGLRLPRVEARQ